MAAMNVILLVLPVWCLIADRHVLAANEEQTNITAEPGHNVTLPCRAEDDGNIVAVEWTRPDLGSEYVLLYRDGHSESDHQHPSFQQRVDLQDRQMKDGDVSLILKNVTTDDTGTYKCRVFQRRTDEIRSTKSINTIHLEVSPAGRTQDGGDEDGGDEDGGDEDGGDEDGGDEDGGDEDGSVGLVVGVTVPSILLVVVVVVVTGGFFLYKRRQRPNQLPPGIVLELQQV